MANPQDIYMPEVHAISSSDESDEEAWEHPAPPGMMPPHGMMQHGMPPGMMLPPGAYFNPQGYHYYPVPQGLPPTTTGSAGSATRIRTF